LTVEKRLPGPPFIRGLIFATIEDTVLYPLSALERFHPAYKNGDMGSYWSLRSYLWTMPRHFAYGAALGAAFDRLRRRRNERPERC
jgi:hypothetical protein